VSEMRAEDCEEEGGFDNHGERFWCELALVGGSC
jgi:hypothetical protein